ncbi:MAG: methyltransferase domain-containing protein [Burkholderiaceae bacterium]
MASLSAFLHTPPGRYALAWEQAQLDRVVGDIFGYHAVQLGLPELDALRENRMPLRLLANERWLEPDAVEGRSIALLTSYEELPLATGSVDLVVLPHTLEFALEPHQVLREVDRILVPEGQVVITGFNPASLWGARQAMTRLGALPFLPAEGQLISLPRVKDWLKLLSFEVNRGRFGGYAPCMGSEKWLQRFGFMEKAGDRWWPVLGALTMITAIKRVRGMRLIGPVRRRRDVVPASMAPAASKALLCGAADPPENPFAASQHGSRSDNV